MSDLLTAADIERYPEFSLDLQDTPIGRLFSLGWNIEARLEKVDQYGAKAADMAISAARLIDEAKKLCDLEGFAAFKRFHCPSLAKSRTYELLAIESGTKTVEEIRAATRERVAKHRAEKKAHVTEKHSVTSLPAQVKVNGQAIKTDDLGPAAQEQIARALSEVEPEATPEELRAKLAEARNEIVSMRADIEHIGDPDDSYDTAWQEAATEIAELHAEIERLKTQAAEPEAVSGDNVVALDGPEQKPGNDPLVEFKRACNKWLPMMTEDERKQARIHHMEWKPKLKRKIAA